MSLGIVIFAHGSSVASANDAVRSLAGQAAGAGNFPLVEVGFLDVQPDLAAAVGRLIERGASRLLILPYFLTLGIHLQRDLPEMVGRLVEAHPGIAIRVAAPLDGHPALAQIVVDRVRDALSGWD